MGRTDADEQLGRMLGQMVYDQQRTNENISPEEVEGQLQLITNETIEIVGTVTVISRLYPDDSFIPDHPVYGYLDSPTLKLDGGYATGGVTWPWSWPSISWAASPATSTLYTTTF